MELDTESVYPFEVAMYEADCPTCKNRLGWIEEVLEETVLFQASCCRVNYRMVPDLVRIEVTEEV